MKKDANELIDELQLLVDTCTEKVLAFRKLPVETLQFKPAPGSWSVLECMEHLNLYGDFYLPEIERRISAAPTVKPGKIFKAGLLGNYFAGLMKVENGKIKKMKSPKDKNTADLTLNPITLDRFLKQQDKLKGLLEQARTVDLTKTKTAISLSPLVKLRLGDTFCFLIFHIERHVIQAERVLAGS